MKDFRRITVLLSMVLLVASASGACTVEIRGDGSPRSAMHHAKAVFIGQVLDISPTPQSKREMGVTPYSVRLRVERYWKGVKTLEVTVHTDMVGCGPHFEVGRKYLVYGFGKELETASSRTKELPFADDDLRVIGPGKQFKQK